jgi:uncharacterized protein with HEPN domain
MRVAQPSNRLGADRDSNGDRAQGRCRQAAARQLAEPMLRRAVERDVEIISEASRYIAEDLKAKHPIIPWRKVAGIGSVLRHGYKLIDDHEMWDIISHDLAPLTATIESMLLEVDGGPDAE